MRYRFHIKIKPVLCSRDGERVTYGYNDAGKLRKVVAGFTEVELGYDASTGLLESANVRSDHRFNMRTRFKYHTGLLKEQKTVFMGSSSPDFSIAVFRYQVWPLRKSKPDRLKNWKVNYPWTEKIFSFMSLIPWSWSPTLEGLFELKRHPIHCFWNYRDTRTGRRSC